MKCPRCNSGEIYYHCASCEKEFQMPNESQSDFEAILEASSNESVALLAIARILLRDSEGDGEAGAIAKELERRSKEI